MQQHQNVSCAYIHLFNTISHALHILHNKTYMGEKFYSFHVFPTNRESFHTNFITVILSANVFANIIFFLIKSKSAVRDDKIQ